MKKYYLWQRLNCQLLNRAQGYRGFSLIEVLVVIAIIAVLSVLVSINFSFFNSVLIKSEIQKLHTICHYLRRKALMTNQIQKLVFDMSKNCYNYDNHQEKITQSVRIGFLCGTKGPPSAPNQLIQQPITFKNNEVIFYPDGNVSSGTVYLIDTNKQYQYALSAPIAQMPYLRMYQFDNKWKLVS